jgi:hypothetical protein
MGKTEFLNLARKQGIAHALISLGFKADDIGWDFYLYENEEREVQGYNRRDRTATPHDFYSDDDLGSPLNGQWGVRWLNSLRYKMRND